MKKSLTLFFTAMLVITITSCKKSKAEKTLRGDWYVTEFDLYVTNTCSGELENIIGYEGSLGTATFDRKDFSINIDLGISNTSCMSNEYVLNGNWNVEDHTRELIFIHSYGTTLADENWTVQFYSDSYGKGQKAKGQDVVYLTKYNSDGSENEIKMIRK